MVKYNEIVRNLESIMRWNIGMPVDPWKKNAETKVCCLKCSKRQGTFANSVSSQWFGFLKLWKNRYQMIVFAYLYNYPWYCDPASDLFSRVKQCTDLGGGGGMALILFQEPTKISYRGPRRSVSLRRKYSWFPRGNLTQQSWSGPGKLHIQNWPSSEKNCVCRRNLTFDTSCCLNSTL